MSIRALIMAVCGFAAALCPHGPGRAGAATAAAQPDEERRESDIDVDRLTSDRDYAADTLEDLDRLLAERSDETELAIAVDSLRLVALVTLERRDEIRRTVERVTGRRPREANDYVSVIYAASAIRDPALMLTVIETASRNVPGVGWPELRSYLERDVVSPLFGQFRRNNQPELRLRLAEALFRIGWPGDGEGGTADYLRSQLIDGRLARGDVQAAAEIAAGITDPDTILTMIVQPRYDAVLGAGSDRLQLLRQALEAHDRASAEAVAAAPQHKRRLLERAQFLRSVGRNAEAVALLEPFIRDAGAAAAESEDGMWLVNEAAYALMALDRSAEAVALMAPIAELPLAEHPYLISASINYAEILEEADRHQQAIDHATRLQREAGDHASDYGEMWIASTIVCGLTELGRAADAGPQLERMRPIADANPAAMTQAHLCLGDDDAASALLVQRLEGADPVPAILALQDYGIGRDAPGIAARYDRLIALRDRPAVQAALARVGRVLTLPLDRTYWGNF